jgi:hypothetical protein
MQVTRKGLILISFLLFCRGCIDPYSPDISDDQVTLVVEALVSESPGVYTVTLSRSSPLNDTETYVVTGALVSVFDDQGGIMDFDEEESGIYSRWIEPGGVVGGRDYWLHVETPDGEIYESDPEQLSAPPPAIGSVYWEFETVGTADPDRPLKGIRFYLDVDGEADQSRNFRWVLEETWEYHAAHYIQYYYDGTLSEWPEPYSYYTCWRSERIPAIYIASTKALERNALKKLPLNFVSDETNRLQERYSLLVKQYSLSDRAYEYWLQVQRQNQETGGIYETQPDRIPGNIHNVDNQDEQVMGYFNLSSVSEKRIFVDGIPNFIYPPIPCELDTIKNLKKDKPSVPLPYFMISLSMMGSGPPYGVGSALCFDCRKGGGDPVPPDFWE